MYQNTAMQSNLTSFLHCTTPLVPHQSLPKNDVMNLNPIWHQSCDIRDSIEYFTLSDLWSCYDEWSAYGAGVPIFLNATGETLVQYYVPYLSAIQVFTSNSSVHTFREEAESGDSEKTRDLFSDSCSSESENEKLWRWDGEGSPEEGGGGGIELESVCHVNDRLGHLCFQYFERSIPYARVPLMDKIIGLAQRYRGLMSLRSVDLSPASWMAVAWYPIYHIPMGRTIKDLSTCFLTYHTLSSSFQDTDAEMESMETKRKEGEGIGLHPFGLATYKMQGNVWASSGTGGRDQERLALLLSVADSWLKQLRVQHHDFDYFNGIRRG